MRTLLRLTLCGGLFAAACGGDDDDSTPGRGSAACQDFQDAACDFAADRCGTSSRAACDQSFQGIECKSDSAASACANALNGASCGQAVGNCDLNAIVDPAPAVSRCMQLVDRICEHFVGCGQLMSREECTLGMMGALDCSNAVSTSLAYEDCLEAIEGLECPTSSVPQLCSGAIKVLPPGVLGGG